MVSRVMTFLFFPLDPAISPAAGRERNSAAARGKEVNSQRTEPK
jgi:hypothetical protein